ncbi:MAG: helix-turn-helix domain-containing protein [Lachnospirales bacterium]
MYEIFEKLLKERGITAYRVAQETGVTTSTLTSWKQGKYVPKMDKLRKIADYLQVSVEYLMTGEESAKDATSPQLTPSEEHDIAKRMAILIGELNQRNEALMFNGEPLDDESRELLRESLENSLRIGKLLAKKKYTPRKYQTPKGSDTDERAD